MTGGSGISGHFILMSERLVRPDGTLGPGWLRVSDGRIQEVGVRVAVPSTGGLPVMNVGQRLLSPGLIDIHCHGAFGFSAAHGGIEGMAANLPRYGVTAFLASLAGLPNIARYHETILDIGRAIGGSMPGAEVLGVHLEGPFLSPHRPGAIPVKSLRPPSLGEFDEMMAEVGHVVRVMTVAPELDGAISLIRRAVDEGVVVSLGHSDADFETGLAAFEAGARHVTHLFNAMRPIHHRDPGLVAAALVSPVTSVEIIADGVHVHPSMIRLVMSCKSREQVVLVSDAVPPAGLGDGSWDYDDRRRIVVGGRCTLEDGTLAGSVSLLNTVVRIAADHTDLPVGWVVNLASLNPARILGVHKRKGALAAGMDADIVVFDDSFQALLTIVRGRAVWKAPGFEPLGSR